MVLRMKVGLACVLLVELAACKEKAPSPTPYVEVAPTPVAEPPSPPAPPPPRCTPGERVCVLDDLVQCKADGSIGDTIETCKGPCRDGACVDTCAVKDVELIYVLDDSATLYSFDPRKLPLDPFHKIAALGCDSMTSTNSMAVDRYGIAWVGYHNGKVHRASIIDGRCLAPGDAPRGAPTTFGMGFVTDGKNAATEKLFVAGANADGPKILATLDTSASPTTWKPIAPLPAMKDNPELTGTGEGRLFGYFPAPGRGFVQELDRTTAKPIGTRWSLGGTSDHVIAYAFAHWGGVFYVFTSVAEGST